MFHALSSRIFIALAATAITLSGSGAAEAAPIKKVLGACDNTPGCSYSINDKTGDISRCSKTSGKCFYCPNDGKRQCFAIRQIPPSGERPAVTGKDVTLTK